MARSAQSLAEAQSQSRATVASLGERLSLKEKEVEGLQHENSELEHKVDVLASSLNREIGERSAAVERANRVPLLEGELKEKEMEQHSLQNQISSLRGEKKELEILLQEER